MSIEELDTMIEVLLEENISYEIDGIVQNESVEHKVMLMYKDESELVVVSDGYYDGFSEFFKNQGRFYNSAADGGSYRPLPGDIFFLGNDVDAATHTGIVVSINGNVITYVL